MPVYVGNSMSFANAGLGGTVEEEIEAFQMVVKAVLERLQPIIKTPGETANGVTGHSN